MDLQALIEGLTPDDLLSMPPDLQEEIEKYIEEERRYKFYNKLEFFQPRPYQKQFMQKGAEHANRYLRAGNRVGKTYGGSAEFAYHLTGLYPDWWEGHRVKGGGHTFWVVGITLESVAKVIQKELIGHSDCRSDELLGSGFIPRRCIVRDQGWIQDGPKLKQCMIRHVTGQLNTLMFYGSENEAAMRGQKVIGAWMDEEALNGSKIYSQIKTRLVDAGGPGIRGFFMFTSTPEQGNTELNQIFNDDETGELYLQAVSMDDIPGKTEEEILKDLAGVPEWQKDMRRHGLPVLGDGAIFPFKDSAISVVEINPLAHWQGIGGIDWGESVDPSVVIIAANDPEKGINYLVDEIYFDKDEFDRSAQNVANWIMSSPYRNLPFQVPHDHPAHAAILRMAGVNVLPAFQNPPDVINRIVNIDNTNQSVRAVEPGLTIFRLMMQEGTLKVAQKCFNWWKEKQGYYYRRKSSGKVEPDGENHAIDASRYAILSLLAGKGAFWSQADQYSNDSFENGYQFNF